MNKERRKKIEELKNDLESLQGDIEDIMSEEEEYRDSMPENLRVLNDMK